MAKAEFNIILSGVTGVLKAAPVVPYLRAHRRSMRRL